MPTSALFSSFSVLPKPKDSCFTSMGGRECQDQKKFKGLERNANRVRGPEVTGAGTELVPRCTLLHPGPAACFSQPRPLRPPQPRASLGARTRRTETEHPPRPRASPSLSQNRSGSVRITPIASQWRSSIFVIKPALQ